MLLFSLCAKGAEQWKVFETSYESAKGYPNPFTDVEVDVVFKHGKNQWKVPAFWNGGSKWTVRFSPPLQGKYTYHVFRTTANGARGRGAKSADTLEEWIHTIIHSPCIPVAGEEETRKMN